MSKQLKFYEKAGRLFRLLGWLQMVAVGLISAAVIIPALVGGQKESDAFSLYIVVVTMILMLAVSVFYLSLGSAIKRHEKWGRIGGIILAVVMLIGFPIGTMAGGYILWCLVKGWESQ